MNRQFHYLPLKIHFIMKNLALVTLITAFAIACSSNPKEKEQNSIESGIEEAKLKPLAELTYYDIWKSLLKENNAPGMDVHGETFGTDGIALLEIKEEGECKNAKCGSNVTMTNTAEEELSVIVSFAFDLPGNPTKGMERWYKIQPGETTSLGCANFCYDGKSYPVSRNVLSAGPSLDEE